MYPQYNALPDTLDTNEPPARLHWTGLVMSLLAFVTLFLSEGQSYILPFLIVLLLASVFVPFRLGKASAPIWMLRIALFGTVLVLDSLRPDDRLNNFFDLKLNWAGELFAAELVIQAWRSRPEGGGRGVVTLFWSGLIFLLACDVSQDPRRFPYILYFAPAYILFALLAVRHFHAASQGDVFPVASAGRKRGANGYEDEEADAPGGVTAQQQRGARARQIGYVMAVAVALTLGMGAHRTFYTYRMQLTYWGMRFLNEQQFWRSGGLSTTPHLGSRDNMKGSTERVARITGEIGDSHWRALSFTRYAKGGWGPSRKERATAPLDGGEGAITIPPRPRTTVTRLVGNNGLLTAPLGATDFDPGDCGDTNWAPLQGGPITTAGRIPSAYSVIVSTSDRPLKPGQGLFCDAPNAEQLKAMLDVPRDIDPRVFALAHSIAPQDAPPLVRARATEHYLIANYHYSLGYRSPPNKDPLSAFVLKPGNAAHCEYFAAAAVMLMRCQKVPARYVIGYYAHEGGGNNTTIVRQRDAHAWAEAWLDGQGWIVIDGTPGDGRPDALAGPIPSWQRAREWIGDTWGRLLETLKGPAGVKIGGGLTVLVFGALGWQWLLQTRRTGGERRAPFRYASAGEELTALKSRFERLCRLRGLLCPDTQTWQEYLEGLALLNAHHSDAADAPTNTNRKPDAKAGTGDAIQAALAFVRAYNAARFDPGANRDTIAALAALLTPLEGKGAK